MQLEDKAQQLKIIFNKNALMQLENKAQQLKDNI